MCGYMCWSVGIDAYTSQVLLYTLQLDPAQCDGHLEVTNNLLGFSNLMKKKAHQESARKMNEK